MIFVFIKLQLNIPFYPFSMGVDYYIYNDDKNHIIY